MKQLEAIAQIKEKLINQLKTGGWYIPLRTYINSSEFDELLLALYNEVNVHGRRFTPELKYVFRPFELCPYDSTKVVIINEEGPYREPGVGDGLAWSCSRVESPRFNLRNILEAVQDTVPILDRQLPISTQLDEKDLTRWARQGVLLLNESLTAQVDTIPIEHHQALWNNFLYLVMDVINDRTDTKIIVLVGNNYNLDTEFVRGSHHTVLVRPLPLRGWRHSDLFNCINSFLWQDSLEGIKW